MVTPNETEARLITSRLRRLGPRVVAVSGNHDSTDLMRRMAERPQNLGFFLRSLATTG